MKKTNNIRHLEREDIQTYLKEQREPAFREKQISEWLWKKSATSFDEMTNLSVPLRKKLSRDFVTDAISVSTMQESRDGTMKYAFKLHDGHFVEGVLIPSGKRMTACVSSQIGCSLACSFCATAAIDLKRNLNFDEIYDQVAIINKNAQEHYSRPLTNIVFMGMGEPLLNYKQVTLGIAKITSENGLGISPSRITVSTAGIAKMIRRLGDEEVKFGLALSLHAANDVKRSKIMSINDSNNLEALAGAMQHYFEKTNNWITFEYVLLKDFNDQMKDADELARFCRKVPCKINLIEYNPIDNGIFQRSKVSQAEAFQQRLGEHKLICNIRRSRGQDIDAACGQLANKN
ncbi:MAG: 23S rRNA (adenine(2503)-C(2))-methyltransferase RlmN [Bacteroidia bacterium]